jgi:hypothetical protein
MAAAVEDPLVPNDEDDAVVDEQERRRRNRQAAMERMLLAQERDADTEEADNPAQIGRVNPAEDGAAAACNKPLACLENNCGGGTDVDYRSTPLCNSEAVFGGRPRRRRTGL